MECDICDAEATIFLHVPVSKYTALCRRHLESQFDLLIMASMGLPDPYSMFRTFRISKKEYIVAKILEE